MMGNTPYGAPSPHHASDTIGAMSPNNSSVQFQYPGASYSKNKRQSTQFVFETNQLANKPLSWSSDTSTGVFGARSQDALSNPAGA
jgi:alpha-galactosidase